MGRIETKVERPAVGDAIAGTGSLGQVAYWSANNVLGGEATLAVSRGGTNLASYATGDLIYASGATTLAKLAIGSANKVLTSTGTAPAWNLLVDANIASAAAIAVNKLAALTASRAMVTDASGFASVSSVTSTELALLSGKVNLEEARNWIHNGAMQIYQLAASTATSAAVDNHTVDRWNMWIAGAGGNYTLSRSSTAPTAAQSGFGAAYSLKADCTGTGTPGTAAYAAIQQFITPQDYANLSGKTVTLSFWVNAVKNGIYCVSIQTAAKQYSYVAEYTISAANTWEKKTVTFTFNQPTEGSTFTGSGYGAIIQWTILAGSNFQTTANAWQTGVYYATSNQVNGADDTANNFFLSLVSLNIGSAAAPFTLSGKNYQAEVALCQRFFEKSGDMDSAPNVSSLLGCAAAFTLTTTKTRAQVPFKVTKHFAPTMAVYSTSTGTAAKFRDVTAAADIAATQNSVGEQGFAFDSTATVTVGNDIKFHWAADSRIGN